MDNMYAHAYTNNHHKIRNNYSTVTVLVTVIGHKAVAGICNELSSSTTHSISPCPQQAPQLTIVLYYDGVIRTSFLEESGPLVVL